MRRREFITLFGGAAAAWPLAARGAGPAHIGFISSLSPAAAADFVDALRGGLAAHGYSEPKARHLGMEISFIPTPNREELDRALSAIEANPLQAIGLFSDAFVVENRKHIIDFAMSRSVPVISGWAIMADSGALCTYGPR